MLNQPDSTEVRRYTIPPGPYRTVSINTDKLIQLIPVFSYLNPGINNGVSTEDSTELWCFRAKYCTGYAVTVYGTTVGIAAVNLDMGPDPHLPYQWVAQMEFTAITPGFPGAACALYQHIKSDLRKRGAEALLVTRMVSNTEFRTRVYALNRSKT